MPNGLNDVLQAFFRWFHVIAGITWIGHLYFFNWVNGPFQGKIDGATKKAANPELLPRALFWFRWGAAWTWITGILLAGLIYYQSRQMLFENGTGNPWLWLFIVLVMWALGFVIYNAIMKRSEERRVGKECRYRWDWSSDVCSPARRQMLCETARGNPCLWLFIVLVMWALGFVIYNAIMK